MAVAILIYIILPILAIILYGVAYKRLAPPIERELFRIKLSIIFFCYGGLLLIGITTILREWSAMASIITGFLIFIAPILMGLIAYDSYRKPNDDTEKIFFKASRSYFISFGLLIVVIFLVGD